MKRRLLAGATALASMALAACGTLAARSDPARSIEALSKHMSGCDRHYVGGVGVGAAFTFDISCKAQPEPAPSVAEPAT
jgi:curli biogenesis system outer membrane secretion channel CsgG